MLAQRCSSFLLALLTLLATAALSSATASPFPCTGGSIYFTAQSIDSVLFQNPDLLHDLYVFKCVTTVVFTADTGGETANDTRVREIERGLEDAYRFMSGGASFEGDGSRPISNMEEPAPSENITTIRIGKYGVAASPVFGMSNVQIIYLRLPGSTYYGQGYAAYHEESLKGLYSADISHITTTDGTATYSVKNLKGVIATILRERRPNDVRVLNHLESLSNGDDDTQLQHADRIVSAKLVMDVIKEEEIEADVIAYASDEVRNLDNNLQTPDYIKKVNTFFEYAKHDPDMCQNLDECGERLQNLDRASEVYYEGDHVYEFLKREYYVT